MRGVVAPRLELPPNHVLAGTVLAMSPQELAAGIEEGQLDGVIAQLPEAWVGELGTSRPDLAGLLKEYFRSVRHS